MSQVSTTGIIGSNITVTVSQKGNLRLRKMIVNAQQATAAATITVHIGSVSASNLVHSGNFRDRDANGAIHFDSPLGDDDTTKYIVKVTGGPASGAVQVSAHLG